MKNKISLFLAFLMISGIALSQAAPESAETILGRAYKQIAKEKKNVFVIFHASWCGWCKKLENPGAPADKGDKPPQNMGCPAADDEVAAFIKILKKTSKITDKEIPVITERFKKNRS